MESIRVLESQSSFFWAQLVVPWDLCVCLRVLARAHGSMVFSLPCFLFHAQVENRTHVKVALARRQSGWMPEGETGDLFVRAVNTGAGMYGFDKVRPTLPQSARVFGIKRLQSSNMVFFIL